MYLIVRKTTTTTASPISRSASEGKGPSGAVGLRFFTGVIDGSIGVCASATGTERTDIVMAATDAATSFREVLIARILATADGTYETAGEEPEVGFEPTTYHLRGGCSTPELLRRSAESTDRGAGTTRGRQGVPLVATAIFVHHACVPSNDVMNGPVRRVMVGTDRSETADRAVKWAASFADRFEAELWVIQVILAQSPVDTEYGAAEATRAGAAADELQKYANELAGERGHARVVIDDDPAMAIVQATVDEQADVLVVGNAGMAGRKEFLLGNVPNRISHNARCTVIIVNTFAPDTGN